MIHRDVATRGKFEYYLREWLKTKYRARYPLAYLAFHGSTGEIGFGSDELALDDLDELMGGKATQRIIYFGSCSTMAAPEPELRGFCKTTGAQAIVGYAKRVEWRDGVAVFGHAPPSPRLREGVKGCLVEGSEGNTHASSRASMWRS